MAEMPVAAIVAVFFFATTGVLGWYAFRLVRGSDRAEAESYSRLIEIQDAHQTAREALIVKEAEVEASVRKTKELQPGFRRLRPR